jgi:hypothetical protein
MGFDLDAFRRAKFEPRTAVVTLDPTIALAAFFGTGEPIEWTVRGLSGNELHRASEAAQNQKARQDVAKALESSSGERVAAIRESLGLAAVGTATPGEMAKRIEMFVMGSVSPAVELPDAVRFAEAFPVEFLQITGQISTLTGEGFDLVKPEAASPQKTGSSPACASPSSEAAISTSSAPT